MDLDLYDLLRDVGGDQPPSTVDVERAVRKGRVLRARRSFRNGGVAVLSAGVVTTVALMAWSAAGPGSVSTVAGNNRQAGPSSIHSPTGSVMPPDALVQMVNVQIAASQGAVTAPVEWIKTTAKAAQRIETAGHRIEEVSGEGWPRPADGQDQAMYVVQLRGRFTFNHSVPYGVKLNTGPVMIIIVRITTTTRSVSDHTLDVSASILRSTPVDLSTMGQVHTYVVK